MLLAQLADADQRVHPLPEEVRGIEVDADRLAADLAQAEERLGVVGDEAGMQLDRHPHAVLAWRTPPPRVQ